jgi:hypothetical protein
MRFSCFYVSQKAKITAIFTDLSRFFLFLREAKLHFRTPKQFVHQKNTHLGLLLI